MKVGRYRERSLTGSLTTYGYIQVRVDGKIYRAHNLAWLYTYGEFPRDLIDHKNGIPSDNRLLNLREATPIQNQQNRKTNKNNSCGFRGVFLDKLSGKWRAKVKIEKKQIYLGLFESPELAHCAWINFTKEKFGDFFPSRGVIS